MQWGQEKTSAPSLVYNEHLPCGIACSVSSPGGRLPKFLCHRLSITPVNSPDAEFCNGGQKKFIILTQQDWFFDWKAIVVNTPSL